MPVNASYSSQKCQNDAKQHTSYSNIFHPKLASNTKTTLKQPPLPSSPTMMEQQQQQKHMNGSYGRLTNKLNCCRSCVRDTDDVLVQKGANDILQSKPKFIAKYQIDPNSNPSCCFERGQIKCKLPESDARKTTMISGAIRRNSIDVNGLLRNSSLMHSFDDNFYDKRNIRQQSLDDCDIKGNTNQRFLKKLSPPQSEPHGDLLRNGNVTYLTQSVGKQNTSNGDGRRVIKQNSLDTYTDVAAGLRNLDVKIRKHKVDILKYTNGHDKSTTYPDHKRMLSYPPSKQQLQNKFDSFTRGTYSNGDCVYPKIGVDSLFHTKNPTFRKNSVVNGGSYGIITSSELYKLRGTPERIT